MKRFLHCVILSCLGCTAAHAVEIDPMTCRMAKFSPNGKEIAFIAKEITTNGAQQYAVAKVATESRATAPFDNGIGAPAINLSAGNGAKPWPFTVMASSCMDYSLNGQTLIVSSGPNLWKIDANGIKPPLQVGKSMGSDIVWLQVINGARFVGHVAVMLAGEPLSRFHIISGLNGNLLATINLPERISKDSTPAISNSGLAVGYVSESWDVCLYKLQTVERLFVTHHGVGNQNPEYRGQPAGEHRHLAFRKNPKDVVIGESVLADFWQAHHPTVHDRIPYVREAEGNHCWIAQYTFVYGRDEGNGMKLLNVDTGGEGCVGGFAQGKVAYESPDCSLDSRRVVCIRNGTLLVYNVGDQHRRMVPPRKDLTADFIKKVPHFINHVIPSPMWFPFSGGGRDSRLAGSLKVVSEDELQVYAWCPLYQDDKTTVTLVEPAVKVAAN